MVYDGPVPGADARVADHDDARWDEAAALAAEQYPEHGSYESWRFECIRRDVARGCARAVGIRERGRLLNTVALYRRLGFVPASHLDAVVVPVVPCSTGAV